MNSQAVIIMTVAYIYGTLSADVPPYLLSSTAAYREYASVVLILRRQDA